MSEINLSKSYKETFLVLKQKILQAQYSAFKAVNNKLIALYWEIGKTITEKQEQDGWGKSTVEKLVADLQVEFPGIKGFSLSNIWRMRNFYLSYKDAANLASLTREIPWFHNVFIFERCKAPLEREFYIKLVMQHSLSQRALSQRIEQDDYKRFATSQTNFDKTIPQRFTQEDLIIKDDYNFDFLLLEKEHQERDVELGLIQNIVKFLAEMGGYFTFMARQQKVLVGEDEYYIDLVFYHRKLQCLVAVEIKADNFQPEHAGKMNFYLSALDDQIRLKEENPSIGIIICKEKKRTVVEYALKDINKPIGVATYNKYSSFKDLPQEIAQYLPSEEELTKRL